MHLLALLLLVLAAPASASPLPDLAVPLRTGATAGADAAVVIGIEDYLRVPDVPYAARDAKLFYDFLVHTRGIPASRVRLLDRGASREQMLEAVGHAGRQVRSDGTVWIYFAGHGAADTSTGERLLLGDDVRMDAAAFSSRGVPVSEIKSLATAGGGAVHLVVDACYGGVGRSGQELLAGKRFLVPAYEVDPTPRILEWNAAGPDQLSGPLEAVRHGAFTYFAVGALRGWADGFVDGTRDGRVTAEEAELYVRDALRAVQVTDQTPTLTTADPSRRVMSSGDGLEAPPELTAALAARPADGPTTAVPPLIDASRRDHVQAWLEETFSRCVARHGRGEPGLDRWYVRFKVKPGPTLKGLLLTSPYDGEVTAAHQATYTCVRQDIRNTRFADPTKAVTFADAVTLSPPDPSDP